MEDFRSKSCKDTTTNRMQMEPYYSYNNNNSHNNGHGHGPGPTSMQDLRCYSASYAGSSSYQYNSQQEAAPPPPPPYVSKDVKMKKVKGMSKSWSFVDPELQRKKRVASYKAYTVEGKMKGSIKKSFRWIKNTCNQVVYGWW